MGGRIRTAGGSDLVPLRGWQALRSGNSTSTKSTASSGERASPQYTQYRNPHIEAQGAIMSSSYSFLWAAGGAKEA